MCYWFYEKIIFAFLKNFRTYFFEIARFAIVFSFVYCCNYAHANNLQTKNKKAQSIESIEKSKQSKILNKQAKIKLDENLSEASLQIAQLALVSAIECNDTMEQAISLSIIGENHVLKNNYKSAIPLFLKSKILFKNTNHDFELANVLFNLGKTYQNIGMNDSSVLYFQDAALIYYKNNFLEEFASCINSLGNIYNHSGNVVKALDFYKAALQIRIKIGNVDKITQSLNNIGTAYFMDAKYDKSLEYFYSTYKIFSQLNRSNDIAVSLNNIGIIYITINKYDKALDCYTQAFQISLKTNNKFAMARDLNSLGVVLSLKNRNNEALSCFQRSLQLYLELNKRFESIDPIGNIALYYKKKKEFVEALKWFKKTYEIALELNESERIGMYYKNIGDLYFEQKNNQMALQNYIKAMRIFEELKLQQQLLEVYQSISNLYFELGNAEKSLNYYKLYNSIKDSIFNKASDERLKEIETKYETEKKENEILNLIKETTVQSAQLEKWRFRLIIFGILIFFVFASIAIYYNRLKRKQKEQIRKAIAEQEKLRLIAVIAAEDKERKRLAKDLHDSLGQILATAKLNISGLDDAIDKGSIDSMQMYNNAITLVDDACTEVRNISHNIMPTALIRLGLIAAINDLINKIIISSKLKIKFTQSGFNLRLEENIEFALYRIVQENLNNIIKHAQASLVTIEIAKNNNYVVLKIQDDGVGMETNLIEKSEGLGLKSIYSRAMMLNGKVHISSEIGKGVLFILEFNV